MATNINTILSWFKTGLKPTENQFRASWTAFWHKDETIPQSSITGLIDVLNAKTENDQFNAHKTDENAHTAAFDKKVDKDGAKQLSDENYTTQAKNTLESLNVSFAGKENKSEKGAADGYAPLDEFMKLASPYLNIVNDLVTGGATNLLSAEQGVILESQINAIYTLLASDNVDLDNVQELVDAIETLQVSLDTILVNDLTTGGVTMALTAEMGKVLKGLIDNLTSLVSSKLNKVGPDTFTGELTIDSEEDGLSGLKLSKLYNPADGDNTLIGNVQTFPTQIAIDSKNNKFIGCANSGSIAKIFSDGTLVNDYVTGLGYVVAIVVDSKDNIYFADASLGTITRIDAITDQRTIIASIDQPVSMVINANDILFICNNYDTFVYQIDTATNVKSVFANIGTTYAADIIIDYLNNVYVSAYNNRVFKIDNVGNVITFFSLPNIAYYLGVNSKNEILCSTYYGMICIFPDETFTTIMYNGNSVPFLIDGVDNILLPVGYQSIQKFDSKGTFLKTYNNIEPNCTGFMFDVNGFVVLLFGMTGNIFELAVYDYQKPLTTNGRGKVVFLSGKPNYFIKADGSLDGTKYAKEAALINKADKSDVEIGLSKKVDNSRVQNSMQHDGTGTKIPTVDGVATAMAQLDHEIWLLQNSKAAITVTSDWVAITLLSNATANRARYRVNGDMVEVDLYILRTNSAGVNNFGVLPSGIAPRNDMYFHGYNVSTSLPVMLSIRPNGAMAVITNTGTEGLAFTLQYKRF